MSLFDTTNVTSTGIEDGEHVVTVIGGEVKPTRAADGRYILLKFRTDFDTTFTQMFTIENKNQQAVNIGLSNLKKLQIAGGKTPGPVGSVDELFGLRFLAKIKNKTDDYGDKAEIIAYKPVPEGGSPF